jgi:hypothetical protein
VPINTFFAHRKTIFFVTMKSWCPPIVTTNKAKYPSPPSILRATLLLTMRYYFVNFSKVFNLTRKLSSASNAGGAGATSAGLLSKFVVPQIFKKNPRLVNVCTGCATFAMGDILAQYLEHRQSGRGKLSFDYWRTFQVGMFGIVMNTFFLHHWYAFLDKVVGSSMTSKVGVAVKMAADQFIYAPFAISSYFCFASFRAELANGDYSLESIYNAFMMKMELRFLKTYMADCVVWPFANFVNFRFVPLPYRPSLSCVVQLLWQTYMSFTAIPTIEVPVIGSEIHVDLMAECSEGVK